MQYSPDWDLASIPPEAIPDKLLKFWRAQRNGSKSGPSRIKDDPATAEKRKKHRLKMARYRAKRTQKQKEPATYPAGNATGSNEA